MIKYFYVLLLSFPFFCVASQGQVKLYQWPNDDRPMLKDQQSNKSTERAKIPLLLKHCPEDEVCKKLVKELNVSWQSSLYAIYVCITGQGLGKNSSRWRYFDEVCGCPIIDDFQDGDLKNVDNYLKEVAAAEKAIAKVQSHQGDEVFSRVKNSLSQRWMFFNQGMSKFPEYAARLRELVDSGVLCRLSLDQTHDFDNGQDVIGSVPIISEQEKSGLELEVQKLSTRIMLLEQELGKRNSPLRNCLYALGGGLVIGIGFVAFQYLYMRMLIVLAHSV